MTYSSIFRQRESSSAVGTLCILSHLLESVGMNVILLGGEASTVSTTVSQYYSSLPGGSVVKNPPSNAGNLGSVPELGRSPGGGNSNPLQYSCLENPMD